MIKVQRKLHRLTWLLLIPLLGFIIWLGVSNRETGLPLQQAPHTSQEAYLP